MVEVKEQYPFIDDNGNKDEGLIKHWAENNNGERYYVEQKETGFRYYEAVDVYPCAFTYEATKIKIENNKEDEETVE